MNKISLFHNKCKQYHLKVTPQRSAIFNILSETDNHPSADEIFKKIQQKFPHISFDTVNRTLLTFAEIGLIDLAEGHGTPRRFDTNLQPHHHFFCVRCGQLTDFDCKACDDLKIPEKLRAKFIINSQRVVLKGLCDLCRTDAAEK